MHKHNISITSDNTPDISVSISRNIRRTSPLICLMLFSLAQSISISTRKTNMFAFLVLMLMPLCLCLCTGENSIRQISGFVLLLMLMLMSRVFSLAYAYACAYAYALVKTSLYYALPHCCHSNRSQLNGRSSGVLSEKSGGGVLPAYQNPYDLTKIRNPIYDLILTSKSCFRPAL